MPQITIPDDLYAELEKRAGMLGLTVEQVLLPAMRHAASLARPRPPLTPEQIAERQKALDRLHQMAVELGARLPPGLVIDDSRETICGLREGAPG